MWRNWQTRMVQVHVPVKGVEVQLLSPALFSSCQPLGWEPLVRRLILAIQRRMRRGRLAQQSVEEVFTDKFHGNLWRGKTSLSGEGSDPPATRTLVAELPTLLHRFNIDSIADIPCGDFAWMREIDLTGISYFGGDIVGQLIQQNNASYASESIRFEKFDLLHDSLPKADLLLCRDCLVHLSLPHIRQVLRNVARGNVKYLLTTTYPRVTKYREIVTGEWRALNLELPPFSFPPPLAQLDERPVARVYTDKSLGLWSVSSILSRIEDL